MTLLSCADGAHDRTGFDKDLLRHGTQLLDAEAEAIARDAMAQSETPEAPATALQQTGASDKAQPGGVLAVRAGASQAAPAAPRVDTLALPIAEQLASASAPALSTAQGQVAAGQQAPQAPRHVAATPAAEGAAAPLRAAQAAAPRHRAHAAASARRDVHASSLIPASGEPVPDNVPDSHCRHCACRSLRRPVALRARGR